MGSIPKAPRNPVSLPRIPSRIIVSSLRLLITLLDFFLCDSNFVHFSSSKDGCQGRENLSQCSPCGELGLHHLRVGCWCLRWDSVDNGVPNCHGSTKICCNACVQLLIPWAVVSGYYHHFHDRLDLSFGIMVWLYNCGYPGYAGRSENLDYHRQLNPDLGNHYIRVELQLRTVDCRSGLHRK